MLIHNVTKGETAWSIAHLYGTSPEKLSEYNELRQNEPLCTRRRLAVLFPTRTYRARGGNELEALARRFGTTPAAIISANPRLASGARIPRDYELAIKFDAPRFGSAIAIGSFYKGCGRDKLREALPYLDYVSFSAYRREGGRTVRFADLGREMELARSAGRVTLIRILTHESADELLAGGDGLCKELSELAKSEGAGGLTLAAYRAAEAPASFSRFLEALKKELDANGLFLAVEADGNGRAYEAAARFADLTLLQYEKCHREAPPSFDAGERRLLTSYGAPRERTAVELPSLAYAGGTPVSLTEVHRATCGGEMSYDAATLLQSFKRSEGDVVSFEAPDNIKAKLELIGELGYAGVSFDIMRTPRIHYLMYYTSFHCTATRTYVREGAL